MVGRIDSVLSIFLVSVSVLSMDVDYIEANVALSFVFVD